jgi:hypothetical protein
MDPTPAPFDVRAHLEARLRTLQGQQQQYIAQANAAAGAIELCTQLLAELPSAPPAGDAGP